MRKNMRPSKRADWVRTKHLNQARKVHGEWEAKQGETIIELIAQYREGKIPWSSVQAKIRKFWPEEKQVRVYTKSMRSRSRRGLD